MTKRRKTKKERLEEKQGVLMFLLVYSEGKKREKLQDKIDKIENKLTRR